MCRKFFFHEDIILDKEEEQEFKSKIPEADNYLEEGLDNLIGAHVTLQYNGQTVKTKVMKRAIRPDGKPIGKYKKKPS